MNNIEIYKTDNAILYFNNSILYLELIKNIIILNEIKTFINYIIEFFKYCNLNNIKITIYYNFGNIKMNNIPILQLFDKTKELFINLTPEDTKCVNCYVIILNNKLLKQSLKIVTKIVNPIKPWKITKSKEKAQLFINNN